MSNMVYACSIYYTSTVYRFTAAFNKCDVAGPQAHVQLDGGLRGCSTRPLIGLQDSPDGAGYVTSLHRSMSLVLDEFYRVLDRVAVSAVDGSGIDELYERMASSRAKCHDDTYGRELEQRIREEQSKRGRSPPATSLGCSATRRRTIPRQVPGAASQAAKEGRRLPRQLFPTLVGVVPEPVIARAPELTLGLAGRRRAPPPHGRARATRTPRRRGRRRRAGTARGRPTRRGTSSS